MNIYDFLRIKDGSQGVGRVFVSDATGKGTWVDLPSDSAGYTKVQVVIPTPSQTVFILDNIVPAGLKPLFLINGIVYEQTEDYTIVGTTLTWINSMILDAGDRVNIYYAT